MGDDESTLVAGGLSDSSFFLNAVPVTCVERGCGICPWTDSRLPLEMSPPVRFAMLIDWRCFKGGDRIGGEGDLAGFGLDSSPVIASSDGNLCSNDMSPD